MKTAIETTNKFFSGDIQNAVEIAMNTTTIEKFIGVLRNELPAYEIIKSGSHIAIHRNNLRVAIISNY